MSSVAYEDKETVARALRAIRARYDKDVYLSYINDLRAILDIQERICYDDVLYDRVTRDDEQFITK